MLAYGEEGTLPVLAENDLSTASPVFHSGVRLTPRFQYVPVARQVARTDGGVIAGAFGN